MPRVFAIRILVAAVAAVALSAAAARADVLYTLTYSGTIQNGQDTGLFGGLGSLAGQAFSETFTFNGTQSQLSSYSTVYNDLYPAVGSVVVTVNGHSFTIVSTPLQYSELYVSSLAGGSNVDQVYSYLVNGSSYAQSFLYTNIPALSFLANDSLSQAMNYSVPNSVNSNASFSASGGSFSAQVSNLSMNSAPAPEPASLALFGAGLAAFGLARRRKAA